MRHPLFTFAFALHLLLAALAAHADWSAPLVRVAAVEVENVTNVIHAVMRADGARFNFPFAVGAGDVVEMKFKYLSGQYVCGTGSYTAEYLSFDQAGIASNQTVVVRCVDGGMYYVDGVAKKNCTMSETGKNFTFGSFSPTASYLDPLTGSVHYVRKFSGGEVVANFVPSVAGLKDEISGAVATVAQGTATFMVLEGGE